MLQAAMVAAVSVALLWRERGRLKTALDREERLRQALIHDLKNPMTSIMGCLTCVVHDSADAETQRRLLKLALHSCRSQLELLDTITDVGRLESGDLKPEVRPFDAARMARAAAEEVKGAAASLGITIQSDVPEEARHWRGDQELLTRAVTHLLHNAVRYTTRGGSVKVSARREGPDLILGVSDAGPRPESDRGLFERYARVSSPAPARRSAGLNLYFCRLVAEAHGGFISMASAPAGASLELRLPGGVPSVPKVSI